MVLGGQRTRQSDCNELVFTFLHSSLLILEQLQLLNLTNQDPESSPTKLWTTATSC
uniref:Uncharacterized protein n=1 Tax=Arundo donax TaxID=35708 RepID=A0A0A9DWW0_ARUDO